MLSNLFGKKPSLCPKGGICSGCEWIETPLSEQHKQKLATQESLLNESNISFPGKLSITSLGKESHRIFLDITLQTEHNTPTLGLYDMDRERIVSIGACPAAIPDLQDFVEALSKDLPPIDRASFRLRVNPFGQWGMWIDAANLDIRTLLNEHRWLKRWMEVSHIEIGQRRKYLKKTNDRLLLEPPFPRQWFKTFLPTENREFVLWSVVGGFSQPSDNGVKHLVQAVTKLLVSCEDASTWLEFGSGSGTFTLPLSQIVGRVIATETSALARQSLQRGLKHHSIENVTVSPLNIQRQTEQSVYLIEQADGLFVDPPRSGLGHTLQTLEKATRKPRYILYVSCHGRTLCQDGDKLQAMGYTLQHIEGVDQFPHTPHCEWISLWTRTE